MKKLQYLPRLWIVSHLRAGIGFLVPDHLPTSVVLKVDRIKLDSPKCSALSRGKCQDMDSDSKLC